MEQQTVIKAAKIIGGSIVLAAMLHGGIYTSEGASQYLCSINKFTGTKDCSR